jgi:hypothetical protein
MSALAGCGLLPTRPFALTCTGPPGMLDVPGYVEIDLDRRTVYDGIAMYVDGAEAKGGGQIDVRFDAHSITWQSATEHRLLWRTELYRDSGRMSLQLPSGRERQAMCRPTPLRKPLV